MATRDAKEVIRARREDLRLRLRETVQRVKLMFDVATMLILLGLMGNVLAYLVAKSEKEPQNLTYIAAVIVCAILILAMSIAFARIVNVFSELASLEIFRALGLAHLAQTSLFVRNAARLIFFGFYIGLLYILFGLSEEIFKGSREVTTPTIERAQ